MDGICFAFLIWLIMFLVSYFKGSDIFLSMNNAKKIEKSDNPQLFNIVEEMTIASGLPKMPDIYIIDEDAPNAFATGRSPDKAAVAVTTGILKILNRNELQGVIAHELSHIKNRDTLFMLFVGILMSSICFLAEMFMRSRFRCSRRSRSSSKGSSAEVILLLICVLVVVLSPLIAQLVYLAVSRKREYLADACAAQFTRYPAGLASALAKISGTTVELKCANKFTAPMYIINPLAFNRKTHKLNDLTSTHPATSKRIEILYKMAGADIVSYNEAFADVMCKKSNLFNDEMLKNVEHLNFIVPPCVNKKNDNNDNSEIDEKISRVRKTEDMMWHLNGYIFQECACGTKIKVPPEFKGKTIICPHCKSELSF